MTDKKKGKGHPARSVPKFTVSKDYADWLANLKSHISCARQRAAIAANQELVRLYHDIGAEILARQIRQGWGAGSGFPAGLVTGHVGG